MSKPKFKVGDTVYRMCYQHVVEEVLSLSDGIHYFISGRYIAVPERGLYATRKESEKAYAKAQEGKG